MVGRFVSEERARRQLEAWGSTAAERGIDEQGRRSTDMETAVASTRPKDLDTLEPLVGTWRVSGGSEGTVRYEWMEGKYFLLQHIDLGQGEEATKGLEVIGHVRPYGGESSADIRSRYYSSGGETLDYTYELLDGVLTIWMGERDSPAYFQGTFSEDGNTCDGAWVYPGGGGYPSTMTRIE